MSFRPNIRLTLFTLALMPLLVGLGCWQLQRAEEKRVLARDFATRMALPPEPLEQLTAAQREDYRPVWVTGVADEAHQLLLDNQLLRGRFGYQVLTPVVLNSGDLVLLNRGWVAGDPSRRQLPAIPPLAPGPWQGHIHTPSQRGLSLPLARQSTWPRVIQRLPDAPLAEWYGAAPLPFTVRLEAGDRSALQVDWQPVNLRPETHTGYAVQWFSMAAALLLLYIAASTDLWQRWRQHRRK